MQEESRRVDGRPARWRAFLHTRWRGLLPWRQKFLLSEEAVHLALAAGVGVLGGLVNLLLYWTAEGFKWLLLGGSGDGTVLAGHLEWWQRLALPALGGLTAGLILHWALRVARLPESGNVLEVVVVGDGRLHFRSAVAKALASLVSITSGGSIGREGPVTHLSATLASQSGRLAGWEPYRLRLLVACGAAAGMAAAYNAPMAGAVFAAQIVLGSFSMHLFGPLVVASVVATMVSRSFQLIAPWYSVPADVEFTGLQQLPWFVVLGAVCGLVGALFLWLLREVSLQAGRRVRQLWLRLSLGGLLVGMLAVLEPRIWGNGYGPTTDILHNHFGLGLLAAVLLAKFTATVITVGSGAVGGIFTPTLFIGAGVGALFGLGLHGVELAPGLPVTAFALVGMGGLVAATTHSPLLALILVFEISPNYTLMPPLMVACAAATLCARRFHEETVYTAPLRRRGILVDHAADGSASTQSRTVGDILRAPIAPVRETTTFRELADRFLTSPYNHVPVVNADGRLIGVVVIQDLKQHLTAGSELDTVIAFDVMRPPPPCLTPDQRVVDAVPVLLTSDLRNVPVVNTRQEMKLIGAVVRAEALGLVSEAIDLRAAT